MIRNLLNEWSKAYWSPFILAPYINPNISTVHIIWQIEIIEKALKESDELVDDEAERQQYEKQVQRYKSKLAEIEQGLERYAASRVKIEQELKLLTAEAEGSQLTSTATTSRVSVGANNSTKL